MSINKSHIVLFTFILISLLVISCGDDDGVTDSGMAVSLRETPFITGFFITENSPDALGVWGTPTGPSSYLHLLKD